MSLEAQLEKTNELLAQVITILQTRASAPAEVAATEEPKKTRKKAEAAPAIETNSQNILGLLPGDPPGTRYWVIEKHNTVFVERPGDTAPTIQGAEIIPAEVYLQKKEEFAKKVSVAAVPATAPVEAPAPATPAASPVSSQPSAPTSGEVSFKDVADRAVALGKSTEPGLGRDVLVTLLKKWLPGEASPTVSKLQPLNKNSAILADIESVFAKAATAAEEFDPLA
jgi:hypothetical protein